MNATIKRDPKHDELLIALGSAMTRWASIEFEVCIVFQQAIRARNKDAASGAFYSVRSTEVRLSLASAAIDALNHSGSISDDLADEWKAIAKKSGKTAQKRAELAHSVITQEKRPKGNLWFLEVFPKMYHNEPEGSERYLTVAQLIERADRFTELGKRVSKFEVKLAAALRTKPLSRLRD